MVMVIDAKTVISSLASLIEIKIEKGIERSPERSTLSIGTV